MSPSRLIPRNTRGKVLLSVAVIGAAAGIAGLGTFASFTGSTSASGTISTGTVAISLGATGTPDHRLTVGASGLVPGDTIERRVKLTNPAGNENLASIVLTTAAAPSSKLDQDPVDGLQMKIEKCSNGTWTESASQPYTYACDTTPGSRTNDGTRVTVLARRAIIGTDMALSNMAALTAGNTDDLVVIIDLPTTADNTFQGLSSTITYTFTGTQRAGTSN